MSVRRRNEAVAAVRALLGLAVVLGGVAEAAPVVLAKQDFEISPAGPVWTYTGTPSDFQSGYSGAGAAPGNSALGIGGSRAWHERAVSAGNPLTFSNVGIASGYASILATFRLAAMNLDGAAGGPDNLDYVLVSYSLDGGGTFVDRVRIRGAVDNNSFWGYDATGVAQVDALPATEAVFQPLTTGLQTTLGYSTVTIVFPGTISQLSLRITPRSSSSTDSWLIDDVTLLGTPQAVPEPGTVGLVGLAMVLGVAGRRRWRRR